MQVPGVPTNSQVRRDGRSGWFWGRSGGSGVLLNMLILHGFSMVKRTQFLRLHLLFCCFVSMFGPESQTSFQKDSSHQKLIKTDWISKVLQRNGLKIVKAFLSSQFVEDDHLQKRCQDLGFWGVYHLRVWCPSLAKETKKIEEPLQNFHWIWFPYVPFCWFKGRYWTWLRDCEVSFPGGHKELGM